MSAKHTPGPWTVGDKNGYRANSVLAGDNAVADVYGLPLHQHIGKFTECEGLANARLIAAAPDLLEALTALVTFNDAPLNDRRPEGYGALLASARAAIAKATGETK